MILLQVITAFLACVTFALCLAHALELPGKLRLDKEAYCAVQTIYYPGFTFGGFAEVLGVVAAAALLLMTPTQSAVFAWTLIGFLGLLATHAAYWTLTHPVNNFWLKGENLKGLGGRFFKVSSLGQQGDSGQVSEEEEAWRRLRDRWEYSHVLRAVFSMAGLLALLVAVSLK
jgi:hypothetical protein